MLSIPRGTVGRTGVALALVSLTLALLTMKLVDAAIDSAIWGK
jgi:hypothetical protein